MDRWRQKVVVVTGASSGIGWAIAQLLLKENMTVIGLSLTLKSEENIKTDLCNQQATSFYQYQCDLSSLEELKSAFLWISKTFTKIHVLINNAGMCEFSRILDENNEDSLKRVLDVNLMAAVFCTKEAYKLMKIAMADEEECHVINICSLLGHYIMPHIPECGFNLYPVAKHALRATNAVLRRELSKDKLVRLSALSPGITATKFGSYLTKPSHLANLPDVPNLLQITKFMKLVRQLRIYPQSYWKHKYAIVMMSHSKAGYPIVLALLDIGMYVVAVSNQLKKTEELRHLMTSKQRVRYEAKEVDLNTLNSINTLMLELKLQVKLVKLVLCLMPQINKEEKMNIFKAENAYLLQTILEVSDLGVGAFCSAASRHVISKEYSHVWLLRFHHKENDLLHDYVEYLISLGSNAPMSLNTNLLRKMKVS